MANNKSTAPSKTAATAAAADRANRLARRSASAPADEPVATDARTSLPTVPEADNPHPVDTAGAPADVLGAAGSPDTVSLALHVASGSC
jgi:hypothetical protein